MEYFSYLSLLLLLCLSVLQTVFSINKDTQYTPAEKQTLIKFKEAVAGIVYKDYQKLDSYLIHFLRRKDMDVGQAKALLQANFKWRKDKNIDSILQEKQMLELEKYFPFSVDEVDKTERPILNYILHKWNIRRFILAGKTEDLQRYQAYILENAAKKVYDKALAGKDVSQIIVLVDLSGFNTRQHGCLACLQGFTELAQLGQKSYPNLIYQAIFINSPRSFNTVLDLVKSILPPKIQQIFHNFSYDKNEWRAHLSKMIDDDQLSSAFGGTRLDKPLI